MLGDDDVANRHNGCFRLLRGWDLGHGYRLNRVAHCGASLVRYLAGAYAHAAGCLRFLMQHAEELGRVPDEEAQGLGPVPGVVAGAYEFGRLTAPAGAFGGVAEL